MTFPLALGACGSEGADDGASDDAGTPGGGKFDTPTDAPEYCAEVACADRLADAMARDFSLPNAIRWQCGDVPGVTGPSSDGGDVDCESFTDGVRSGDMDQAVACHNNAACSIDDVTAWNNGEFESTSCISVGPADDRGQEYCEYFAVIDPAKIAPDATDKFEDLQVLGRTTSTANGAPYNFDFDQLSGEQLLWLEDEEDPDAVVGACVFTSWHWDTTAPSQNPEQLDVHGYEVSFDNFRMHGRFNSNGAARKLVFDALAGIAASTRDRRESGQPAAAHPYWAACMGMTDCPSTQSGCGGGVEWRVSDPTISAMVSTMSECGCFVELPDGTQVRDAEAIAAAVIPDGGDGDGDGLLDLRGFRIGTWSGENELPANCRYVEHDANPETGAEDTHTIVECDITAGDIANTTNASEMKDFCRGKYGDDVIVHVPLPADLIKCEPAEDAPPYCGGAAPWAFDDVPDTVELTNDDIPAGSVCRASAAGDSESSRGGSQVNDENNQTAE